MSSLTKPRYPHGFTSLVAEVADTVMRAMPQIDPYDYIENEAIPQMIEVARLQRGLTVEDHLDPFHRRAYRLEVLRAKIVRDLSMQLIAYFNFYDKQRRYSANLSALSTTAPKGPLWHEDRGTAGTFLSMRGGGRSADAKPLISKLA